MRRPSAEMGARGVAGRSDGTPTVQTYNPGSCCKPCNRMCSDGWTLPESVPAWRATATCASVCLCLYGAWVRFSKFSMLFFISHVSVESTMHARPQT